MGEKAYIIILDKFGNDRLRLKIVTVKGKISYFVIQFETFIDNNWHSIVRYDNAHGFFHRDVMNHKGEKEKQAINIINLEDAFSYAQQDLKDRWDFYKERYLKQLRK